MINAENLSRIDDLHAIAKEENIVVSPSSEAALRKWLDDKPRVAIFLYNDGSFVARQYKPSRLPAVRFFPDSPSP